MFTLPNVLVLRQHKNYYLATHALASAFGIVVSVTRDTSRVQPIGDQQLDLIRRHAAAANVGVKIARSQEELEVLAVRGECELSQFEWVSLDRKCSGHTSATSEVRPGHAKIEFGFDN